jgi:hypothetical protein
MQDIHQTLKLIRQGALVGLGENVVHELNRYVGPLFTRLILGWFKDQSDANPNFFNSLLQQLDVPTVPGVKVEISGDLAAQFVLLLIRKHRDEIIAYVSAHLEEIFDEVVVLIEQRA